MYSMYRKIFADSFRQHCRCYTRTPVIGVLGHVDHGKTTLIDNLRKTNNVSLEAGGITQRNSVFQHTILENQFQFTIVDTPGHAAFSSMRINGTVLTDVAILVVDAGEGVKQQTIECIKLLHRHKIPVVVALNKIDLPKADIDRTIEMLFEHGVETEQAGGEVPAIGISALHGSNVPQLMKAVQSVAENLDLTATLDGIMEGIIFDIQRKGNKLVTTIVVKAGTIKKGDTIFTADRATSVKSLDFPDGGTLRVGKPGMPVNVVGHQAYSDHYCVGDTICSIGATKTTKQRSQNHRLVKERQNELRVNKEIFNKTYEKLPPGKTKISVLICADSNSTLEILTQMLDIDTDECKVCIFMSTVKPLTKQDILLAEAVDAQIILFNVAPLKYETTATVHHYDIIYDLAKSLTDEITDILPTQYKETVIGRGIIAEIHGTKKKRVIGVNRLKGTFKVNENFALKRRGNPIWNGSIASMKFVKEPIHETSKIMTECGVSFHKMSLSNVQCGDVFECYRNDTIDLELISKKFFGREDFIE